MVEPPNSEAPQDATQNIPDIMEYPDLQRPVVQERYGDDFMKQIVEVDELIERIEHMLKGQIYDEASNKFVEKYERLINDKGISKIMSIIRSRIHKHLHLTNFSEEDVKRIAYEVRMTIIDLLAINQEEFGINKSDLTLVEINVDHMVYTALKRAYQQGERRAIFGATQRHIGETISPYPQQMGGSVQKKKWWPF